MHTTDSDSTTTTTMLAENIAALTAASRNQYAKAVAIEVVAETGSTNTDLLARIATLTTPTLLVANAQTAGRGRAGRVWHTRENSALIGSLAWKFRRPVHALMGLPLAVGVALAETLRVCGVAVELKWPNDVLREGAKLGGILVETARTIDYSTGHSTSHSTWVVIGMGVNLVVSEELQSCIDRVPAAAPELLGMDRARLLALLLGALCDALAEFDVHGFAAFAARWNRLHAYAGRAVRIFDAALDHARVVHEGRAVGVDEEGCLLIDTANGRVAVMAGDVSLRLQE